MAKLVKPKKKSVKTLRNKCDRLLQELGRKVYKKCIVCGRPMSCLHHVFPKSMSSKLRYDWQNVVPLCFGCHFSHHNGNPTIMRMILEVKGEDWLTDLEIKKQEIVKTDRLFYENIIKQLSKGL